MIAILASPDSNIHVHDQLGLGQSQPLRQQPPMPKASDCSIDPTRAQLKSHLSENHQKNLSDRPARTIIHIINGYDICTPFWWVSTCRMDPARSNPHGLPSTIVPWELLWSPLLLVYWSKVDPVFASFFFLFGLLFSGRLSNPARRPSSVVEHWHMDSILPAYPLRSNRVGCVTHHILRSWRRRSNARWSEWRLVPWTGVRTVTY